MLGKVIISGICFYLVILSVGYARSETGPIYAGWAVGDAWNGYGTILRSTDSGKTWVRQGDGQIANVYMGAVFAVDHFTAWVVGQSDSGYATIYYTADGGRTWQRKGSSNTAAQDYVPDVDLSKVHAAGNEVWAVGTGGTILHTHDKGATWTNQYPSGYGTVYLQGVYALDSSTVWVTGETMDGYATIFKTTDGGLNWTRQSGGDVVNALYLLGISAADSATAWAVGRPYIILKTTDGGTTWNKDPHFGGLADINEVYAVNASTVWAATDNEIVWSNDGGTTWEHSRDHGLFGAIAFMGISAVSDRKAWTSFNGSDQFVAYTPDGGNTWTKLDQLNGDHLPNMNNISFATQPIHTFPWHLFVPPVTANKRK